MLSYTLQPSSAEQPLKNSEEFDATVEGKLMRPDKAFYVMLIIVPSVRDWKDRRSNLRKQFLRNKALTSQTALLLFLMSSGLRPDNDIEEEARSHEDMVSLDCEDVDSSQPVEESSTTCKVLRGIQFAYESYQFRFLARIGDDAYFRWDYFMDNVVPGLPKGPLYAGHFFGGSKVLEPQIQEHLFLDEYPPYASGMGFVVTWDVTKYITEASLILPFHTGYPEDATVALWLIGTRTKRFPLPGFVNYQDGISCTNDTVLIH